MNRVFALIGVGFVIITACMLYLAKSGVSIRAETLIRPTVITEQKDLLALSTFLRLNPQLRDSDYFVIGISDDFPESSHFFEDFKRRYERDLQKPVHLLDLRGKSSFDELRSCTLPCWVLVEPTKSNELNDPTFIKEHLRPIGKPFFTLTTIGFTRPVEIPEGCNEQKHLTYDCLRPLAIHEFQRKMKGDGRYFFMKRHQGTDNFLFVEQKK